MSLFSEIEIIAGLATFFNIFVSSVKSEDFHAVDTSLLDLESECGADYMEALDSGRPGVYGEHVVPFVPRHLEDMGVAAYEDVGTVEVDQGEGTGIVTARIAAYMGHQHLQSLAFEYAVERVDEAEAVVVAVACHAFQRLELRYLFCQFKTSSEITCVPDLIDRFEKFTEWRIEYAVSIGNQAYIHIRQSFMTIFFL